MRASVEPRHGVVLLGSLTGRISRTDKIEVFDRDGEIEIDHASLTIRV